MPKFRMTKAEAQLIVDAIVVWENGQNEEGIEAGCIDACPLCSKYFYSMCAECPVARYTGELNCNGTPHPFQFGRDEDIRMIQIIAFGLKMLDDAGYEIVEE